MSSEQTSKFIHNFKKGDIVHFHGARFECSEFKAIAEANARLIAAAPELLDELIEQDKFLGVLAGTVPLSEKDTHRRIAMHRESVRAAITKATGQ